jgi:hypothetical protein
MKITGIEIICQKANKDISTWHDVYETSVEDTINKVKHQKNWMGGKFVEIYLEFDNNGKYDKFYLDIKKNEYNKLLGVVLQGRLI